MTINSDVMEDYLVRPVKEESGPSPTQVEEAILLGKEDRPSWAPGPTPLQVEISWFIECAEWNSNPVTSTALHHHPP